MTIVIGRDGAVRDVIEGIMYAEEFDRQVKPLLIGRDATSGFAAWPPLNLHVHQGY